ncbi:MAG TPA: GatB/YqeY domain-containing protein [Saprospiraceae bacterium]|nr:GatB/YqeY domain-containing protein [Saprospiraceae bacterium]
MTIALLDKIAADMKDAMKGGKKLRLETLRTLRAGLLEKQVEKRPSGGMTPDDEIAVLNSALKKRKEAITIYRQNGRDDLADQEEQELAIIQEYLPKQLSQEEIEQLVRRIIAEAGASGAKDFGKVMPLAMKELKGKADGKIVQETAKKLLGE